MDEFDVADLFAQLEGLHDAGALSASELAAKKAAFARGCPNFWPHRGQEPGPASRWTLGACATTAHCSEQMCFWQPR